MRYRYLICVFLVAALSMCGVALRAQSEILVTGRVSSSVDDGPMAGTRIFIFKTEAEGKREFQRAMAMYEQDYLPEGICRDVLSQQDGEYELKVPSTGSLVFYHHPFKPKLVRVAGQRRHNVVIEATRILRPSIKTEEGKKIVKKGRVFGFGNNFNVKNFPYYIDLSCLGQVEGPGKTNARLVAQVFLVNADGSDTLEYFTPKVYDGEEFHRTQFHWRRDRLYEIAETMPPLTADRDSIMFNQKFSVEHPEQMYFCRANIWIEDYIKTYYQDTVELLNTGRVSRPFQFLEYSFAHQRLDSLKYFKAPRRELVETPRNMKLKFKMGASQLDMSDAQTVADLDSLKRDLRLISDDASSSIKEIHFRGYASPDGPYLKNLALSESRTRTVMDEVLSCLPADDLPMIYRTSQGAVAGWQEVIPLLEADSMNETTQELKNIISIFPTDIGAQGYRARKLPGYKSVIAPKLEQLRMVKCEYVAEINRYRTPEEIISRYNEDPDLRSGKKPMALNEYWHLFYMIDDKEDLAKLYRNALDASFKAEREYWALPANLLAVMHLERKQADTTLLKPFINENWPLNYSLMDANTGIRRIINDDAIVANQVMMYMLVKDYVRAEELSSMIEGKHPMLRAIVRCLGGYLDPDNPDDMALIGKIQESSPRNRAIMNMYAEKYDSTTVSALNQLPHDDALTYYLKAQRLCLKNSNQMVTMKNADFSRSDDPYFRHPEDKELPVPTEEEIEAQRQRVEELQQILDSDIALGIEDAISQSERELKAATALLADMEKRESVVVPYSGILSDYDAAYIYLKECFSRDSKFVLTAKADADINEDLLNDVLGIKRAGK